MTGAMLRVFLIAVTLLTLAACYAGEVEKQWYKPGVDYTIAEFKQDQAACTKNRVLDEACLRQRGWVGLSGDRDPPVKAAEPASRSGSGGPRY
jgi:hypothetical protein